LRSELEHSGGLAGRHSRGNTGVGLGMQKEWRRILGSSESVEGLEVVTEVDIARNRHFAGLLLDKLGWTALEEVGRC
jgi:hypothetical protein